MSIHWQQCGAVASYGREIAHKSNCPSMPGNKHELASSREKRSMTAMRELIAREIWRYQECPWDFDNPPDGMAQLQKQMALDQAEGIKNIVLTSAVFHAHFIADV